MDDTQRSTKANTLASVSDDIVTPWIDLGYYEEFVKCSYHDHIQRQVLDLPLSAHSHSSELGAGGTETLDGFPLEVDKTLKATLVPHGRTSIWSSYVKKGSYEVNYRPRAGHTAPYMFSVDHDIKSVYSLNIYEDENTDQELSTRGLRSSGVHENMRK